MFLCLRRKFRILLPTTTYYYLLRPTTTYYYLLLPTTTYYYLLLPTSEDGGFPLPQLLNG